MKREFYTLRLPHVLSYTYLSSFKSKFQKDIDLSKIQFLPVVLLKVNIQSSRLGLNEVSDYLLMKCQVIFTDRDNSSINNEFYEKRIN